MNTNKRVTKKQLGEAMKKIEEDRLKGQRAVGSAIILVALAVFFTVCFLAGCVSPEQEMKEVPERTQELRAYSWDHEVGRLKEELKPYNIKVFRVNPDDPDHQRRYQRHLSGDLNPPPLYVPTPYQGHKKHYYGKLNIVFDRECEVCVGMLLDI